MNVESQHKSISPKMKRPIVFRDIQIRRMFHDGEWYFSITDIVQVLTKSRNPPRYWSDLKTQITEKEGYIQLYEKIVQLKFESSDGKKYRTDATNTETLLRIIQSNPSPQTEPFKRWLAKVGYERVQETENPELATQRTRALYKANGYPDDWIEKRLRRITIREELTAESGNRGIEQERDYAILTGEISKATFAMTPSDYKKHKGLKQENLRDHMTPIELIFSMLGEASTKEIAVNQNAQGFEQNKAAAQSGGRIAGAPRKQLEKESKKLVVSKTNYLGLAASTKPVEIDKDSF